MAKQAKYKQLGRALITDIENQIYQPGDSLPSLRNFCAIHQVSMTTALTCYRYVELKGYITSKPKYGYFVSHHFQSEVTYTFPAFQAKTKTIAPPVSDPAQDTQSLATAELDSQLIDTKLLNKSLATICKHHDEIWGYAATKGEMTLRHSLSNHFATQGFSVLAHDLTITHGCLDAVQLAVEVISNENDIILVSSPCYSGLLDILFMLKRRVLEIPSTDQGVDLTQMETALKTQKIAGCLLTSNYQNPTGHCLTNAQKQRIAELAYCYQTPIIEDDVFRELSHNNSVPLPIKHFDQHGWIIWCGSFSKSLSAGLRLGWCAPGKVYEQFTTQQKVRTLGSNKPMQLAIAHYIKQGHYLRHLKHINRQLAAHKHQYLTYLTPKLPKNCSIYIPAGGLVLWLKIPGLNTLLLSKELAQSGIYIKPGKQFSSTSLYNDCFRLNIGLILSEPVKAQLNTIANKINLKVT